MAEREFYEVIKDALEKQFKARGADVHLEITADKRFSDRLKSRISDDIIFVFLKQASPDITGFVEEQYYPKFIVVEVKEDKIKLDDIYQLKKYADLFNAYFAFLISLEPVPEEIKRLFKSNVLLRSKLTSSYLQAFALARFDSANHEFVDWFEENPFENDVYWKR